LAAQMMLLGAGVLARPSGWRQAIEFHAAARKLMRRLACPWRMWRL
jgi:hypothetical protein